MNLGDPCQGLGAPAKRRIDLLPIILVALFLLLLVIGVVLGNVFETYHMGSSL